MPLLLAADVGGTKTLVGLYDAETHPPSACDVDQVRTRDFEGLVPLVAAFLKGRETEVSAACVGLAGPVHRQRARLTNVPWLVSAQELKDHFSLPRVHLLNDVAAAACALSTLRKDQCETLQAGQPDPGGNKALVAPGTGLGEALVHKVAGRPVPVASEAGHADFPARTLREWALVSVLTAQRGRTSLEDVLSGPGLVNIFRFCHGDQACSAIPTATPADELPAAVTHEGISGRCERCAEALELFVSALGAEAGNLGLRGFATGGVFVGGGIAPRILPALRRASFIEAFQSKAPMDALLRAMPVAVITEPKAVLLGAAAAAQQLSSL